MRIHIATDHAGIDVSRHLIEHLKEAGHVVIDHGPTTFDAVDDYPALCINTAHAVVRDQQAGIDALGIVIGGSGNGEQIAANKVVGARAALVWSESTAVLARAHNDANIVSIGARQHSVEDITKLVDVFVAEPFSKELRHVRRVTQIAEYEATGDIRGKGIDR